MSDHGNAIPQVILDDPFWNRFRETVVREGIPYQWEALNDRLPDAEPSYCMRNFRIAAGKAAGEHGGCVFQDSDVYKWIEGASYTLQWRPDPALEGTVDSAIAAIAEAQQPDGYLDTYYIINGLDKRWTDLKDDHELYCAGHLIEAAVAHHRATGKRSLLEVALRLVDHIDSVIGPEADKLHGYPGHPIIEMALMRLYAVTGDPRHLKLAKYFIDQRGRSPLFFAEEDARRGAGDLWDSGISDYRYYQAHKPLREQEEAVGHAVRAVYLYAGMADVARETGDESLKAACRRLWRNMVERRMYVTGAIGSSEYGEAFTFDYDLPNDTVYGETCASIGLMFFARRMLALEMKGEYADVMERALYNGVISGMQLDGKRFFYVNPLEVVPQACAEDHNKRHVKPERQKWFACACCPPNIMRLLSSLEDYICTVADDTLFIHLYAGGVIDAGDLTVRVETHYPWEGQVRLSIQAKAPVERAIALRVPGWCRNWKLRIDDAAIEAEPVEGYVSLRRRWQGGETIVLDMDMPVQRLRADPRVREDIGKAALQRGPLVYCLEEADNGRALHALRHAQDPAPRATWRPELLSGIVTLDTDGLRERTTDWEGPPYQEIEVISDPVRLHWIPYYAWANRGIGEMRVWVRT